MNFHGTHSPGSLLDRARQASLVDGRANTALIERLIHQEVVTQGYAESPSRSSSLQGNSWQLRPARTTRPGTSTIGFDNTPKQNPRLESAEVPEARRSRTIPWRDQLGRRRHLRRLARDGSCAVGGVEDGIRIVARTVHPANAELTAADFGFLASASCSAA